MNIKLPPYLEEAIEMALKEAYLRGYNDAKRKLSSKKQDSKETPR